MSQSETIRLAQDFSRVPAGRYLSDGPQSGEAFREKFLLPALERSQAVEVDLDGAEGYGSSFLEEAFAGAMRRLRLTADEFNSRVRFRATEDPSLLLEIAGYLADQDARSKARA